MDAARHRPNHEIGGPGAFRPHREADDVTDAPIDEFSAESLHVIS
jgi:hypothetical protein